MITQTRAWSTPQKDLCMQLFKTGYTDREVSEQMSRKYVREFSVHSIRSLRGRLERAGVLRRGLSGSSKEKNMTRKKPRRQQWSKKADARLIELVYLGFTFRKIARMLVEEGLRREFNAGAVQDRIGGFKKRGRIKLDQIQPQLPFKAKVKPKITKPSEKTPEEKRTANLVTIRPILGQPDQFEVSNVTLAEIMNLCTRDRLGLVQGAPTCS